MQLLPVSHVHSFAVTRGITATEAEELPGGKQFEDPSDGYRVILIQRGTTLPQEYLAKTE